MTYLIFDLLQLDGRPLMDLAYSERRALLDGLALTGPFWQTPPSFPGEDFDAVQEVSGQHGMEGVVAKRLDSRYAPGVRTDRWRKIKNVRTQEAVVAGYKPGKGNRTGQVGSLLIGVHDASGPDLRRSRRDRVHRRDAAHAGRTSCGRCGAPTRRSTARSRPSTPAPRSGSSPGW